MGRSSVSLAQLHKPTHQIWLKMETFESHPSERELAFLDPTGLQWDYVACNDVHHLVSNCFIKFFICYPGVRENPEG